MNKVDEMTRPELEAEVLKLRAMHYDPERTAFITVTVIGQDVAVGVYGAGAAYNEALKILEHGSGNNTEQNQGGSGPNPDDPVA